MANRLQKQATVVYTPGTPYVPGTPAYSTGGETKNDDTRRSLYSSSAGVSPSSGVMTILDDDGDYHFFFVGQINAAFVAQPVTTKRVCYPAIPAQPATPSTLAYSSVTGWNAGGLSIQPMLNDGAFRFEVNPNAVGVVVGLVAQDRSQQFNEAAHAFYVHNGVVDVLESGQVVATAPTAHDATKPLAISRAGATIYYTYDGWVHTSAVEASTDPLYLDAAIYLSGDYVDNPELLPGPVYGEGQLIGELPALAAYLTDAASYANLAGELPALTALLSGTSGRTGELVGTLPPLAAMLGDTTGYGQLTGKLPALSGALDGGFPETTVGYLAGLLPALASWMFGYTGGTGELVGELPALAAMLGDQSGYGQLIGELPALRGFALARPETDYGRADNSMMVLADTYLIRTHPRARISDTLQIADSLMLRVVISGAVFDALSLSSNVSAYHVLRALVQSGLLLAGSVGEPIAPVQYAVNVLTSALTTYTGFDFGAFALAGDGFYACRPDGLYRLRPGDDDGAPIAVSVDFGTTDYGSVMAKTVQDVFLGLTTDGEVIVTLRGDGTERSYRAVARGPMMRATAARGAMARRWNLVLEVTDVTEFELDTVEHIVGVAARRQIR